MIEKLTEKSIPEILSLIKAGKTSPEDLRAGALKRIEETKEYNANITVLTERGAAVGGGNGALCGIPVALKDNMCLKGVKTTAASKMLENFVPPYSAEVAVRLQKAGAEIVAKNNMDEFAIGTTGGASLLGAVKNAADKTRAAGGSSSGGAVAVALGQVALSLGTDTGGSVRQPASYNGVVGLKPTYGLIPRTGIIELASSLDTVGILARHVESAAAALNVLAGADGADMTAARLDNKEDYTSFNKSLKGKTFAIIKEQESAAAGTAGEAVFAKTEAAVTAAGGKVIRVSMPVIAKSVAAYYIICCGEAASAMSRYDGVKFGYAAAASGLNELYFNTRSQGFGAAVKERILFGNFVLGRENIESYFLSARRVMTETALAFSGLFEKADFIISPTCPSGAPIAGGRSGPEEMERTDIFTIPANLAHVPAISLPLFTDGKLPLGLQITAAKFNERALLGAAAGLTEQLR